MATPKLIRSWARTEALLQDARAHLSKAIVAKFVEDLAQFDKFISHNELGLAFSTLTSLATESQAESIRVLELLAKAAASMGLADQQRTLDNHISRLLGRKHETSLPSQDA